MSTLRSRLIRLAHAKPELRSELLPLLRVGTKKPTFSQAKEAVFQELQKTGWRVKSNLKVPKAEKKFDRDMVILHFKPQAVWLEIKGVSPARSLHTDIRTVDPRKWVASLKGEVERVRKLEERMSKLGANIPSILQWMQKAKTVVEGPSIRVRLSSNNIYMEEIPQKPLRRRKVRVMAVVNTAPPSIPGMNYFLPVNLMRDAKIGKSDSYDQALKKIRDALGKAEKDVSQLWEDSADTNPRLQGKKPDPWFPRIDETEVNYMLIEPADYKPLKIEGKDFTVTVNWQNFEAYSPDSDLGQMDPYYTKYEASSPTDARKLYKMVKPKPDLIKNVPWSDFDKWLAQNKIKHKTLFSTWS